MTPTATDTSTKGTTVFTLRIIATIAPSHVLVSLKLIIPYFH
jgi:hypothetical protein